MKEDEKTAAKKATNSTMVIRYNNPEAVRIIRTLAMLQEGRTLKSLVSHLIAEWMMKNCQKTLDDCVGIFGYKK